jgi:DNA invertase Pin-like site-specific DNA recombinase
MKPAANALIQLCPKIHAHHLERLAIVYVRQSHPQQAERHPESAEVQANLKQQAITWGWPADRVLVLDGDQGKSATTTVGRDDFAWLLSEITLQHVGLLLGFQINRLVREDEACARLIKVCALFDTLLADTDGVYHPQDFNDRLVLSVKGLMGGIELHQIQQRMQAGRLNKARRGLWLGEPPLGYIIGSDGKLEFDPDEQVQAFVRMLFDQFEQQGSVSGLLRYLAHHHLQVPVRSHMGETKGQLQWRRPHRETLRNLLRHPAYCGTYTWGRRKIDPQRALPGRRGTGRVVLDPQGCAVFLPDNHAAYITVERYQANDARLTRNRERGPQPRPDREPVSLLAGLVVCGVCGCRMRTRHTKGLRYQCQRHALDYGTRACQSLSGVAVERLVAEQVLEAVQPASLALSLAASQEIERERAQLDRAWQLRLERAQQEVDRASRQYDAVEPENRLVARSLERKWEGALVSRRGLQEEYDRFRQAQPTTLTAADRSQLESLSSDLPSLWRSPKTSVTDKRQIIRLLLEKVRVWAPPDSSTVTFECHWSGGVATRHEVRRRVGSWQRLAEYETMLSRIAVLRSLDWKSRRIAAQLTEEGFQNPSGKAITATNVRQLLSRRSRRGTSPQRPR